MNEHTPAPWQVAMYGYGSAGHYAIKRGPLAIARLPMEYTTAGLGCTPDINANLIAAAPDLLAALKGMLEAYAPRAEESAKHHGEAMLHSSVREARFAIRKAKGQA